MENLNITQGYWGIAENHMDEFKNQYTILSLMTHTVCEVTRHNYREVGKNKFKYEGELHIDKEAEANAKLIADAGTTYNTTPILPSELLKQRNELLEALEMCAQDFCNGNIQNNPSSETRIKVFDVLNNCTNA